MELETIKHLAISQIENEQQRRITERETQHQRTAATYEATMAKIVRENLRKHSELDAEYERCMAGNEADLENARKEWCDPAEASKSAPAKVSSRKERP